MNGRPTDGRGDRLAGGDARRAAARADREIEVLPG
jgi:hypothetical protein